MEIKVLGTGCAKCKKLEKTVREVVNELGVDATIEDITDIKKIMEYPILATPGLVIDEKLISSGKVLSWAEISAFIREATGK